MKSPAAPGERSYRQALDYINKRNYVYALRHLQMADADGHTEAQAHLSSIYLDQSIVEKYDPSNGHDAQRSARLTQQYLEKAAKGGHMASLRTLWEDIMPERGDLRGEIKWAARAARQGDKFALMRLEELLKTETDQEILTQLKFKFAALYCDGLFVEKDMRQFLNNLGASAMMRDEKSITFLKKHKESLEEIAKQGSTHLLCALAILNQGRDERKTYTLSRMAATRAQAEGSTFKRICRRVQYESFMRIIARSGYTGRILEDVSLESFIALSETPDYDTILARLTAQNRFSTR